MAEVIASTYEIISEIGSGGGGVVYLAYHLRLGKKVILKVDKRKITTRPELLRREVDILKNLSHSYIPQVYDFFIENNSVYTVMDFIEGESLDRPLKRGERFPQAQVIRWAKQLLEALCYLHSPTHGNPPRGFVHSDIKPANLMRTPANDICLIDFNIALALGEESVVGRSAGYASPEHYGLDYSHVSSGETERSVRTETVLDSRMTETINERTETVTIAELQSKTVYKKVMPDVRSDIYSVGATLYHLLCGVRPAKSATEVVPLSKSEFSPQIVHIITKAMNPNPDLRYQTAEEMLHDFQNLHDNDPRTKKLKRVRKIGTTVLALMGIVGIASTFAGLKGMQKEENRLKLAEYSQNALSEGDREMAIQYALEAEPQKEPKAQLALTDALGVYDLADGFKKHGVAKLEKNPLYLAVSPDGTTAASLSEDKISIVDIESATEIMSLDAVDSAMAEIEYLNPDTIVYAGKNGVTAYGISSKEELWTGEMATAISVSQDGKYVAAVYKDETYAVIYDAATGEKINQVEFEGKSQNVTMVSDRFANANQSIFEFNSDGTMLAVSFEDGSLCIYDLKNEELKLLDGTEGYTHFSGGFYEKYFAFTAASEEKTIFIVVDTVQKTQTIGFENKTLMNVKTDSEGIYLKSNNALVQIDPTTGDQIPLVTSDELIEQFAVGEAYTAITTKEKLLVFDKNAKLITVFDEMKEIGLLQIAEEVVVTGTIDVPELNIVKYEENTESEIFQYDSSWEHDEARISADGDKVMLFSYKQFCIYDKSGNVIAEVEIEKPDSVYDQQFIRKEGKSYLEVTYSDGRILSYDAENGELIGETLSDAPDMSLFEEFYTDKFRFEAPLHGTPVVYDKESGDKIRELEEDAYLTYVTQVGKYILVQYMNAEGEAYGAILNEDCEKLANLPYLCDVYGGKIYFDYPTGSIRESNIYDVDTLVKLSK